MGLAVVMPAKTARLLSAVVEQELEGASREAGVPQIPPNRVGSRTNIVILLLLHRLP
jgi:hypothetical protein